MLLRTSEAANRKRTTSFGLARPCGLSELDRQVRCGFSLAIQRIEHRDMPHLTRAIVSPCGVHRRSNLPDQRGGASRNLETARRDSQGRFSPWDFSRQHFSRRRRQERTGTRSRPSARQSGGLKLLQAFALAGQFFVPDMLDPAFRVQAKVLPAAIRMPDFAQHHTVGKCNHGFRWPRGCYLARVFDLREPPARQQRSGCRTPRSPPGRRARPAEPRTRNPRPDSRGRFHNPRHRVQRQIVVLTREPSQHHPGPFSLGRPLYASPSHNDRPASKKARRPWRAQT